MSRFDRIGHRGRRSRHHRCSFSSSPSSCSHRRTYRDTSQRGRPPNQDERELIVDRQSSQLVPEAATSPMVASSPDGRGAVSGSAVAVRFQTCRMVRQKPSRCFHQYSRWQLLQMLSPTYQLVYEVPILLIHMKPYFCQDFLDSRMSLPVFLHDKKPSEMCSLSGKMILVSKR
jgi:hypothetical protein